MKVVVGAILFAASAYTAAFAQEVIDDSANAVGKDLAELAVSAVSAELKDPFSAKFKSLTHPSPMYQQYPKKTVCGLVNAKNGFGGYNGFVPFAYNTVRKTVTILSSDSLASSGGALVLVTFKSTSCASALGVTIPGL